MPGDTDLRVAAVVAAVADRVESAYVFAPAGADAAAALRAGLASGAYAGMAYAPKLASRLTTDLQAVLPDLRVQTRWSAEARSGSPVGAWEDPKPRAAYRAREALENHGFECVERLPGNVGRLVVHTLGRPEETENVIDAAFAFLARCSALILDLQRTIAGAPTGVAYLLGHLLPPDTPLVEVRNRAGDVLERTATPSNRAPTLGEEVPVFVLIGRRTVSACEELAYDLRASGRATLVGARTIGGANPVDVFGVDAHVVLRMPTAYVRHIDTGSNWEGVGIEPDVPCASDDALGTAHRLAVDAVRERLRRGEIPATEALLEELGDVEAELDEQLGIRLPSKSRHWDV